MNYLRELIKSFIHSFFVAHQFTLVMSPEKKYKKIEIREKLVYNTPKSNQPEVLNWADMER